MVTAIDALADAVVTRIGPAPLPDVIALGEPLHGEPAFLALASSVLDRLVERGVRSLALETDAVAAGALDDWVRGGPGALDDVLTAGFTHGFGERTGMRELVAAVRVRNDELPTSERVAMHGFDLPTEAGGAPSPRPSLEHLHGYLLAGRAAVPVTAAELDALLGPDEPWGTWEAQLDAAASVGATPEAVRLRAVADDLVAALHAAAPHLVAATSLAAWREADRHGRTALALLRYHAVAARPGDAAGRLGRLLGARDEGMARHLRAIRDVERGRGPTLLLAQDGHLARSPGLWSVDGVGTATWSPAGAIVAATGPERYVHVAGLLAASSALGVGAPPPGTVEAALLAQLPGGGVLADAAVCAGLPSRDDVAREHGYLPLGADALTGPDAPDAVVVLDAGPVDAEPADAAGDPTVRGLAARLLARPGVTHQRADEASGAPAVAHGDWFFLAAPGDRMPFATIVCSDYPGHDEASRLDRPGVFRLNLGVGRDVAGEVVVPDADPSAADTWLRHPVYGAQGWVAIVAPSPARLPEIDRLIDVALARAAR